MALFATREPAVDREEFLQRLVEGPIGQEMRERDAKEQAARRQAPLAEWRRLEREKLQQGAELHKVTAAADVELAKALEALKVAQLRRHEAHGREWSTLAALDSQQNRHVAELRELAPTMLADFRGWLLSLQHDSGDLGRSKLYDIVERLVGPMPDVPFDRTNFGRQQIVGPWYAAREAEIERVVRAIVAARGELDTPELLGLPDAEMATRLAELRAGILGE